MSLGTRLFAAPLATSPCSRVGCLWIPFGPPIEKKRPSDHKGVGLGFERRRSPFRSVLDGKEERSNEMELRPPRTLARRSGLEREGQASCGSKEEGPKMRPVGRKRGGQPNGGVSVIRILCSICSTLHQPSHHPSDRISYPSPRPAEPPLPRRPPSFSRASSLPSPHPVAHLVAMRRRGVPLPPRHVWCRSVGCGVDQITSSGRSLSVRPPHVQAVRRQGAAMARALPSRRGWDEEERIDTKDAREKKRNGRRGRGKKRRERKEEQGKRTWTTAWSWRRAWNQMQKRVETRASRTRKDERD